MKPFSESTRPKPPPPKGKAHAGKTRPPWIRRHVTAVLAVIIAFLVPTIVFLSILVATDSGFGGKRDSEEDWEKVDTDTQYDVAVHEAGHAVVLAIVMPEKFIKSIYLVTSKREEDDTLGMTIWSTNRSETVTLEKLDTRTLVDYAGEIAEEVILGNDPQEKSTDYKHAKKNLYERIRKLCKDPDACDKLLKNTAGKVLTMKDAVTGLEKLSSDRAKKYIEANREVVIRLANLLMLQPEQNRRRTLTGFQIYAFLKKEKLKLVNPEAKKAEEQKEDKEHEHAEDPKQPMPELQQPYESPWDRLSP